MVSDEAIWTVSRKGIGIAQKLQTLGEGRMRHFSDEQWIDFARNVVGSRERAQMESHLSEGCGRCAKALSLWQRVSEAGRREAANTPPESVIGTVRGTFAIRGPRRTGRTAQAMASLLFDSAKVPAMAGVRSTAVTERQLLYGVHRYRIDVRIEPQQNSAKVALVGQILDSTAPSEGIGVVPVRLCRAGKVLAESVTSARGEFLLECDLSKGFQLRVKLPTEELCLPLVEPTIEPGITSSEVFDAKQIGSFVARSKKGTRKKV